MMRLGLALSSLALAMPSAAQGLQAAVVAPDAARLSAAKRTLATLMPPEMRAKMVDTMLAPMMANIHQTLRSSPSLKAAFEGDPAAAATVERFVGKQQDRSVALLRTMLPDMFLAMERAYARRFTVAQLDELTAFFQTPTGRIYMEQSMTIMSDPDVLGWQRALMERSMQNIEADVKALQAEMVAGAAK